MYSNLEHRFRRLLFNWDPQDSAKHHSETFTPIMTIMKGVTAKLDLYLDIKDKPKGIHFQFNNAKANSHFEIKLDGKKLNLEDKKTIHLTTDLNVTVNAAGNSLTDKTKHKLEIKCKGEFEDEFTFTARAFKEDDKSTTPPTIGRKGEVCGMLRILPNAKMYQRKIEVVIVNVITNFNGDVKEGKDIPTYDASLAEITNLLSQAYIIPKLIKVDLDTTKNDDFKNNYTRLSPIAIAAPVVLTAADRILDPSKSLERDPATGVYSGFSIELDRRLNLKYKNKYSNSIRLYFLDEVLLSKAFNSITNGYSANDIYGLTLCFKTMAIETAAHELGHTLGLKHPFDGYSKNTLFTHHFATTNSLMDYTHWLTNGRRESLFHWHWQIINTKLR